MAARPVIKLSANEWRAKAQAADQAGDAAAALRIFEEGVAALPADAALANSAGNAAMRTQEFAAAARLFGAASQSDPAALEFALNQAIALSRMEKHREAAAVLEPFASQGRGVARYCSARAIAERGAGNLAQAQEWFDRCLSLEPRHPRALHGRARLALERGESDALGRFDAALAVNNGDADLWLGRAQALDVEGRSDEARQIAQSLADQAPGWEHGMKFLAQLRLGTGESDFASHYGDAAQKVPTDPNIPADWADLLAGLDRSAEAADIIAHARVRFPHVERFPLLEAIHAGAAGDDARAEEIFSTLSLESPERAIHEARHRIRRGELATAEKLLDMVIAQVPWSVGAWALRGIVWRLTGDGRADWLHGQAKLVQFRPLQADASVLENASVLLDALHDTSPLPLGQSLRGGTQTRGILFSRMEPELAALQAAILRTIEAWRADAPPLDPAHPLLRHRDTPLGLAGSWSVRLGGNHVDAGAEAGDHHTAHIHPLGILSSALYCEVPPTDAANPDAGALEIGRPPPDLRLDLPPLRTIRPEAGSLALFPSTLYHGTRPFAAARRMSVAFDVVAVNGATHD